jgi:hypothetical protein
MLALPRALLGLIRPLHGCVPVPRSAFATRAVRHTNGWPFASLRARHGDPPRSGRDSSVSPCPGQTSLARATRLPRHPRAPADPPLGRPGARGRGGVVGAVRIGVVRDRWGAAVTRWSRFVAPPIRPLL